VSSLNRNGGDHGGPKEGPEEEEAMLVAMARLSGHGLTLAMAVGLFFLLGWWVDGRLGSRPLFAIVGALIGAAGGFYHILQHLLFFPRERERERRGQSLEDGDAG
jgi:F0F1-type ATP synthase assembly protein I